MATLPFSCFFMVQASQKKFWDPVRSPFGMYPSAIILLVLSISMCPNRLCKVFKELSLPLEATMRVFTGFLRRMSSL